MAEDAQHNRFGTERTIEALNKNADAAPEEIVKNVKIAIHDFVKYTPQFDDTTMLCVKRTGDLL